MVEYGMVGYDIEQYGMEYQGRVWNNMVGYDMEQYGRVWYDMDWGIVQCSMVGYGMDSLVWIGVWVWLWV